MQPDKVYGTILVPDINEYGFVNGTCLASTEISIVDVVGLTAEIEALKTENAQLREWLSWGRYSAR